MQNVSCVHACAPLWFCLYTVQGLYDLWLKMTWEQKAENRSLPEKNYSDACIDTVCLLITVFLHT